jgi:hypothetical protein
MRYREGIRAGFAGDGAGMWLEGMAGDSVYLTAERLRRGVFLPRWVTVSLPSPRRAFLCLCGEIRAIHTDRQRRLIDLPPLREHRLIYLHQVNNIICILSSSSLSKIFEKVFKILKWNSILDVMIDRGHSRLHRSGTHSAFRIRPDEGRGFR